MIDPVLCAIDFSPHSDRVVERAITRALDLDAPIVLLHAMFTPSDTDYDAQEGSPRTTMWRGLLQEAEAQMARYATRVTEAGVRVDTAFVDGIASVAIREAADTHHAQLIVMGGSDRAAWVKFFTGSVSDNVRADGDRRVEVVKA